MSLISKIFKFNKNLRLSDSCQIPYLDLIYGKYFKSTGFFVEIGAYDGESFSNTSGLADIGWTGHYVEPVKSFAQKCALRHKQNLVEVHNLAISNETGFVEISVGEALSTASHETLDAYKEMDWASSTEFSKSTESVKCTTLDNFLKLINAPQAFELLVVDVEGFEEKVFEGFDFSVWSPQMIIVELVDYHASFDVHQSIQKSSRRVREFIVEQGYMQIYCDEVNSIFALPRRNF